MLKGVIMMKRLRKEISILLLVVFVNSILGCASQNQAVQSAAPAASVPAQARAKEPAPYIIQPGDEMDIKFFYNPELNELVTVRPDGKISLQLIDEIQASGKTPAELDKALTDFYARELRKPVITVIVRSTKGQRVYVGGEVTTQGMIELPPGMTALQAVFHAGGFLETAQPAEALVIRRGPENYPVPYRVNLTSAMNGNGEEADFRLQPDDVVYVPKSAIAEANKFVNQYIEKLLLFRGVSFGVSYEIWKND
jgi:protein involved in polysaccharide export with SLBB domain